MDGGRPAFSHPLTALATPKHFIGDGGAQWGTSTTTLQGVRFQIDQGDARLDEATLRALFLPPYRAAIVAGAQCVMVSYSSWNGARLHGSRYLLSDVLKGELGFTGFLLSDWDAIGQLPGDYDSDVATAINAGLDMIMVPSDYRAFIAALTGAVQRGDVPMRRIDDAVRRILKVKVLLGLFDRPFVEASARPELGAAPNRALAREAVRRSLVLLTNRQRTLPLAKATPRLFVAGAAADDIGRQCGGWTIDWQGKPGAITPGTTILEGIRRTVGQGARVDYRRDGRFDNLTDPQGRPLTADVGIAVVGEEPYAEGFGDSADLALPAEERAAVARLRARCARLVVVLIAGRPLILGDLLAEADAIVVAWLPGSEGHGVADALFGDHPFRGRLPYAWPRSAGQLPLGFAAPVTAGCDGPLFPRGHGLTTDSPSPPPPACPPP
jgi:beta-glucosidase